MAAMSPAVCFRDSLDLHNGPKCVVVSFRRDTPARSAVTKQDNQSHSTSDTHYTLRAVRPTHSVDLSSLSVNILWAYHYKMAHQSTHEITGDVFSSRKAI